MIAGSIRRGIIFFCLPAVALCVSAWAQDDSGADGTMEMIFPMRIVILTLWASRQKATAKPRSDRN